MKKITLIAAALFVGATAFAQDIIIDRPTPADGGTGLISTVGDDFSIYTADHFVLEEETLLGEFYFHAFGQGDASGDVASYITGFNLFIFEDDGMGSPVGNPSWEESQAVLELKNLSTDKFHIQVLEQGEGILDHTNIQINITEANGEDVTLPAGAYWVSAAPTVEGSAGGSGRWNWIGSSAETEYEGVLLDPSDAFGEGATFWMPVSELIGEPFKSFAWTLKDGGILGVDDFEANTFKHFVKNNQLLITSDLEINNVAIYNSIGQQVISQSVNTTSANINLGNLSNGVYFAQANVNGEVKTFKFAK